MLNDSYYLLKPLIFRKLQIFLRRKIAEKKRREHLNDWPIYPGSEKKPENWQGWSGGKNFSLLLTHDVEHQKGYDKVLQLMELEKRMGFVSAFYFIPERDYNVENELLLTLMQNGFEYGIHGLKHDGKLYKNKKIFMKRSKKINNYMKIWGCRGFRSPSMHHNLEWLKELNIHYDQSTFDTDPFEPQPDGVRTIFPFWVGDKDFSRGFLEIPYTLPQDHSLFVILQQKSDKIWREKLDWIAENGGMALVNIHPDYVNFENKFTGEEYPVKLYEDFLLYVKKNYDLQYWNALPRSLTKYFINQFR
jgi:hypothetical protein